MSREIVEIEDTLRRISESLNGRFDEVKRLLDSHLAELEVQTLEAISDIKRDIGLLRQRVEKLEANSAWNLLLEEANKLGITPEELLKRALTEYARKVKKQVK